MANITFQIEKEDDLRFLLELVRRLNLGTVQENPKTVEIASSDRQRMVEYILGYSNKNPSFGEASLWQKQERADRELPFVI